MAQGLQQAAHGSSLEHSLHKQHQSRTHTACAPVLDWPHTMDLGSVWIRPTDQPHMHNTGQGQSSVNYTQWMRLEQTHTAHRASPGQALQVALAPDHAESRVSPDLPSTLHPAQGEQGWRWRTLHALPTLGSIQHVGPVCECNMATRWVWHPWSARWTSKHQEKESKNGE